MRRRLLIDGCDGAGMHHTSPADSPGLTRYAALFAVALAVRLLYIAEWKATSLATVLVGDGRQYDLWARTIADGDWVGGQVFYQAPLYPYFMATVYALLGQELWTLRLVQCLLGSISCVLLALAGRRFFSPTAGLVSGLLLALYAPALYFDGLVQKGVLGGLLMTLLLFTLGELVKRRAGGWLLAAGLTLGAFALARENALVLPPLLASIVRLLALVVMAVPVKLTSPAPASASSVTDAPKLADAAAL